MKTTSPSRVYCSRCGHEIPIKGAKIILDNRIICGDCIYKLEHGRESIAFRSRLLP